MVTRRMEWNGCNVTTITFDAMRGTRGVEYRAIPSEANFALRSCLSKRQREEKKEGKEKKKKDREMQLRYQWRWGFAGDAAVAEKRD